MNLPNYVADELKLIGESIWYPSEEDIRHKVYDDTLYLSVQCCLCDTREYFQTGYLEEMLYEHAKEEGWIDLGDKAWLCPECDT